MHVSRSCWLALTLVIVGVSPLAAEVRQFYSPYWEKKGGYYYRHYYHRPSEQATAFRYHLVVFYPTRPRYYYYYNPYTARYWGRYDLVARGFSTLDVKDQKEKTGDIPETAFPKPGPLPAIPEATDRQQIAPPPHGLPPDESTELTREKIQQLLGSLTQDPPRQGYSSWCKQGVYYFRCYYYQPVAGGPYKSHRVIFYPERSSHLYFFDPYKGKYWGRYELDTKGFALLNEKDQSEELARIPAGAFGKAGEMPPIPTSMDRIKMLAPPQEMPE